MRTHLRLQKKSRPVAFLLPDRFLTCLFLHLFIRPVLIPDRHHRKSHRRNHRHQIILEIFQVIRGKEAIYCISDSCNCSYSSDYCQNPEYGLAVFVLFFLFISSLSLDAAIISSTLLMLPRPFLCSFGKSFFIYYNTLRSV